MIKSFEEFNMNESSVWSGSLYNDGLHKSMDKLSKNSDGSYILVSVAASDSNKVTYTFMLNGDVKCDGTVCGKWNPAKPSSIIKFLKTENTEDQEDFDYSGLLKSLE